MRKHLSTSCKSQRGTEGDASRLPATAEEDVLAPRKRRRPHRRSTNLTAETDSASDTECTRTSHRSTRTHSYSDQSTSDHSPNSQGNRFRTSHSRSPTQHTHPNYSTYSSDHRRAPQTRATAERLPQHGSVESRQRIPHGHQGLLDVDAQFDVPVALPGSEPASGPVGGQDYGLAGNRADVICTGDSLRVTPAGAFAPPPDTLGSLSFLDKEVNEWTQSPGHAHTGHIPMQDIGSGGSHAPGADRVGVSSVSGVGAGALSVVGVREASTGGVYASGSGVQNVHGVEVHAPASGVDNTWSTTSDAGNNMDDLFSWLFNIANSSGSRPMAWANNLPADSLKIVDPLTAPDSRVLGHGEGAEHAVRENVGGEGLDSRYQTIHPNPQHTCVHTRTEGVDTGVASERIGSCVCGRSSPSQHTHPRPIRHTGETFPFPPFPESWETESSASQLPPPAEVLDAHTQDAILELFDGAARNDLLSPAFSLSHMRLYFELYFMYVTRQKLGTFPADAAGISHLCTPSSTDRPSDTAACRLTYSWPSFVLAQLLRRTRRVSVSRREYTNVSGTGSSR